MAVPKRKVSSARQNKRRSNVWKLDAPALMKCPQCGEYKTPHRVCGNCGYYNGREVVKKDAYLFKFMKAFLWNVLTECQKRHDIVTYM